MNRNIGAQLARMRRRIKDAQRTGERIHQNGDPGEGISVNNVTQSHYVSSEVWKFDIARTPQVVKGTSNGQYISVDIHKKAWKANLKNPMVDYLSHKVKGR